MSHKLLVYKKEHSLKEVNKYLNFVREDVEIKIEDDILQEHLQEEILADFIWVFGSLTQNEKKIVSSFPISRTLLHRQKQSSYISYDIAHNGNFFVNLDTDSLDMINNLPTLPNDSFFITLTQLQQEFVSNLLVYHGHGTSKGWMAKIEEFPKSRIVLSFACRSTLNKNKELSFAHQAVLDGKVKTFFGTNCLINHNHNKELMHIILKLLFEYPNTPIAILIDNIKKIYKNEKRVLTTLEKFELIGDPTASLF